VTVVEIVSVVACAETGLYWESEVEPAKCTDDSHQHHVFEVHRHHDLVTLPDGTKLTAVSFDPGDPYSRHPKPDFGLYLDARWQPPWDHAHIDWPDFGLPEDTDAVQRSLRALLDRARSGERVEVGCLGGHGRTGTALASLAVLSGYPAGDAVNWVRAHYCSKAVETPEQEAFVAVMDQS
jgi:Protein-tyrosine phosphatase